MTIKPKEHTIFLCLTFGLAKTLKNPEGQTQDYRQDNCFCISWRILLHVPTAVANLPGNKAIKEISCCNHEIDWLKSYHWAHCVIFEGTVQQKIVPEKGHEILNGTIRQVRNAKKFEIPTTEIWVNPG